MASDCVVSPLGFTSTENYQNIRNGLSGIEQVEDFQLSPTPVHVAQFQQVDVPELTTRFEFICQQAIDGLFQQTPLNKEKTLFILATTKGNINLLDSGVHQPGIHLHETASKVCRYAGLAHHLVISNACISGVLALIVAKRYLENGKYDHALVVGADVLSKFIVSGFQSLMALSSEACKPFDAERQGINLGEAAGAMLLTANPDELKIKPTVRLSGSGLTNDANHISGPSRTGEELSLAVNCAIKEAGIQAHEVDFISAHGTGTLYNDEMEAKAFHHAGLQHVPLHSLKGNFGHTLGAAGVVETVMSLHGLQHNEILPTKGYQRSGVSKPVTISQRLEKRPLQTCLKTASGFGGCNAAIILQKEN